MIPNLLVQAIAELLRKALAEYKMQAEGQDDKSVTVYEQHIPDEDFESDTYYPLVIVSCQNVEDKEEGSTATIGLTIGVYGDDKEAWIDLLNIMEHIRQSLLKYRTIDQRFRLAFPTKFETIEAQPYPFWFAYATLTYTIGQPEEEEIEFGDY